LPPIKGIEHQIDLISSSVIPNRPIYRSNPEKIKELQSQVELMSKGYIQENMSPCVVLILLVNDRHFILWVNDMFDEFHGSCLFSKIDLKSGYH